jgi:hypothetical protein
MRAEIGEVYESSTTPRRALEKAKGQRLSLRRAIDEFEDVLATATGGAAAEQLRAALDHLRVVFGVHVEVTESAGGLYEEILEIAPRLANKIVRFKREHATISSEIQSALDDLRGDGALSDPERRADLEHLYAVLSRHRTRGLDLVYEAYHVDIGGES